MTKLSKPASLLIVAAVYVLAFFAGLFIYSILYFLSPLVRFLAADAAATVLFWLSGLLFKNASMYDPYWSVAPIVLIICFINISAKLDIIGILYLAVLSFWGVRLTLNWATGWRGMAQQDWRILCCAAKTLVCGS